VVWSEGGGRAVDLDLMVCFFYFFFRAFPWVFYYSIFVFVELYMN